jgi:hypothetical protein
MFCKTIIKITTSTIGVLPFILVLAYANIDIPGGNQSSGMSFETVVLEVLEGYQVTSLILNPTQNYRILEALKFQQYNKKKVKVFCSP